MPLPLGGTVKRCFARPDEKQAELEKNCWVFKRGKKPCVTVCATIGYKYQHTHTEAWFK